jgi:hypothetical protein
VKVHLFHLANPQRLRGHELEAKPVAIRDATRTVNHLMRAVVEAFDSDGWVQGITDGDVDPQGTQARFALDQRLVAPPETEVADTACAKVEA